MRRYDYELIARAIKAARDDAPDATAAIDATARSIAVKLDEEYTNFNRDRFLNACGMADNQ